MKQKINNLKISVITPSYNSGDFIERAIKSVIEQDYKNFEHIIIDGGSTDNTIQIIKKYKNLNWISEPDGGQADAMNKGFKKSTGDIIVYLNADDYFFPGAFSSVIKEFKKGSKFVVGDVLVKSSRLQCEFINTPRITLEGMLRHWEPNAFSHNPVGYFYLREVQERCPFNINNYATMDLEFLLDAASKFELIKINRKLGCFEDGNNTKTSRTQSRLDYWQKSTFPYIDKYLESFPFNKKKIFLRDRRNGYSKMQAHMNRINDENIKLILLNDLPSISIIIPSYNCSKYIKRAVDSVLSQNLKNFEVIIVNDASTDDTKEILNKYYKDNTSIKIIDHLENKKLGASRNTGIGVAKGKYIFFLDSDDWIEKGSLQVLLSIAEKYDSEIVECGIQKVFNDGRKEFYHAHAISCSGGTEALNFFADYYIASIVWNKLYLREFIEREKLLFISPYWFEDVVFTVNALFKCNKYISIKNIYCNYFQREDSYNYSKPNLLNLKSNINVYVEFINFLNNIKLYKNEEEKELSRRLLRSHCSNDVFPKMLSYIKSNPGKEWKTQIFDACYDFWGIEGYAIADFFVKSMEQQIGFVKISLISKNVLKKIFKKLHISKENFFYLYRKLPLPIKNIYRYFKYKILGN